LTFVEKAGFRVPALAILRDTPSVKSSIRDNKLAQLETIMQTSRSEGMFTMELYEREFINTRTSFVHPHKTFGMMSETSKEPDFKSTLIDPLAVQDVIYMTSVEDDLKRDDETAKRDDGEPQYVVLDDDVDLKDLIAQFSGGEETKTEDDKVVR